MSKRVHYRECTINSTPVLLTGRNDWRPGIEISSQREGIVTSRPYSDDTTYPTEEAADAYGIQLGKNIIDGKAPELSGNYDEREPFTDRTSFSERL
jgi:hypothetical protein